MGSEGNDRTIMQITTVLVICAMASEVSEGVCGVVGVVVIITKPMLLITENKRMIYKFRVYPTFTHISLVPKLIRVWFSG